MTAQAYAGWNPDGSYTPEGEEAEGLTSGGENGAQRIPNAQELANMNAPNTGQSFWSKVKKWFTGQDDAQAYENYLTANNREYEKALIQSQRDYEDRVRQEERQREDTKYQRTVNDIKAAGLNPWLALQGGMSGSSAQSQPVGDGNFNRSSSAKSTDKDKSTGAIAAFIMAAAKVVAALL